jgi:hypothetical protein
MKPFRNKGWPYFKKFEGILPQSGAKGKHAYAPASAVPALPDTDSESIVGGGKELEKQDGLEWGLQNADTSVGMDVDGRASIIPSISVSETSESSMRKRGFSALSIDNLSLAGSFATAPPSSPPTHTSEPPRKKRSTGSSSAASSSQSASTITNRSSRSATTGRITNAVALNSMQGSINRLTDAFEKSMTTPLDMVASKQNEAFVLLQSRDDNLDRAQVTKIIDIFRTDPSAVNAYIALSNDGMRRDWLHGPQMLGSPGAAESVGASSM